MRKVTKKVQPKVNTYDKAYRKKMTRTRNELRKGTVSRYR